MISSVTEFLGQLVETFAPLEARADDDVEDEEVEDDEDEDEEDEDEDEVSDQLETLREEYKNTPEGKELSKHYIECVERVQKEKELPNYDELEFKEDCVEEFFHLQHYLDSNAAPRLMDMLK